MPRFSLLSAKLSSNSYLSRSYVIFGSWPDSFASVNVLAIVVRMKGVEVLEEEQENMELVAMIRTLIRKEEQTLTLFPFFLLNKDLMLKRSKSDIIQPQGH